MSPKFSLSDLHDCIMDLHNRRWARQLGLHEAHQEAVLKKREAARPYGVPRQERAGKAPRLINPRPSLTLVETEK